MGSSEKTWRVNMKVICIISLILVITTTTLAKPQSYAAEPYSYTYAVKDEKAGTNFGESVRGAGDNAKGSYYVALPDGRLQTVNYNVAGEGGYVAEVAYSGGSSYSN